MKIQFVLPLPGANPSGGHVFNGRIVAEAARRGYPLRVLPCPQDGPPSAPALAPGVPVLWDSLFIERLAAEPPARDGAIHGLLVHYVPFLDPALSRAERAAREQRFDRAAAGMDFFLATGRGVGALLRRRYPGLPTAVSEPGVDPLFASVRQKPAGFRAAGPVRLATVANLLPAKGHLDLLEDLHALAQLPWEWHIAGSDSVDPAFAECLRVRIGEAGLAPRVIFHGVLDPPGVASLLAASDLFVFPSRYEAYGMAIAEAAAAGVPILTTAVGEAARLVRDGKTGLVLAPDDRAGFRDAVARLLGDAALRERLRATLRTDLVRTWPDAFEDFWSGLEAVLGEVKVNAAGPRATPPPNGSSPG